MNAFIVGRLLCAVVGVSLFATSGDARAVLPVRDPVKVELVSERTGLEPGREVRLGVRLVHAPGWHSYWRNPGDSGLPTELQLESPGGWTARPFEWPTPSRYAVGPLANHGYEGETLLPFRLRVPADWTDAEATIVARVTYLACKEVCIPGEARVSLRLPNLDAPLASRHASVFERLDAIAARPDPGLQLRAYLDARALTLEAPGSKTPARVEFFPYDPGVSAPPAPQYLIEHGEGWLLRVARPDQGAIDPGAIERIAGVIVIDGRAVEIDAPVERRPAPAGVRSIATVMPIGAAPPVDAALPVDAAATPRGAATDLLRALLLALFGGLLLNLMPCVLPVVGLKALALLGTAEVRSTQRALIAGAYAGGVVTTFLALALLMLSLRAAGSQIGWGFQLESPSFLAAMALLFFLVGLNLLGVFDIRGPNVDGGVMRRPSPGGAFADGVLGTLVATPCSAPFMGAAIGYTLNRTPLEALTVFFALGVGLALPVVTIALRPSLISRLPKPGTWMLSLRRALSLPMFATVVWLAWLLVRRTDASSVLTLGTALLLAGTAAALFGRTASTRRRGFAFRVGAATVMGSALVVASPDAVRVVVSGGPSSTATANAWEPYSRARLDELRAAGRIVFVEFTADWCVICHANDAMVLSRPWAQRLFSEHRVALLRADWTRQDATITQALAELDRNSVPVYAVYSGSGAKPNVLPELLTRAALEDAIARAAAAE